MTLAELRSLIHEENILYKKYLEMLRERERNLLVETQLELLTQRIEEINALVHDPLQVLSKRIGTDVSYAYYLLSRPVTDLDQITFPVVIDQLRSLDPNLELNSFTPSLISQLIAGNHL